MERRRISGCIGAISTVFLLVCALDSGRAHGAEDIRSKIENDARLFTIEVRDASISDVLRALAQQSGFNLVLAEGVDGKLTLSLKDVAFKDALEIILKGGGLSSTVQNNVFLIGKKVDSTQDFSVEVITLNYADPAFAATQMKNILTEQGAAYPDTRLNALIVRDLPKNIEAARKFLKAIDAQTTQVVIEARIVEASASFSRQLGIQWGGAYSQGKDAIRGSNLLPVSTGGRNFAVNLPSAGATSGIGLVLGNFSKKVILDIELSAAESRGELKIVSRPKISTLNNRSATIHSGLTFRIKLNQGITISGAGSTAASSGSTGSTTSGVQEIKTGIDLTVTPKVSSDDFIHLNISTNKSDPDFAHQVDGIPGITEKSASTHVLVKDGETVVIGGLYKMISSDQTNAVPYLSRIPLIGFLFENNTSTKQDEELIVFITPKIVRYDSKTEVAH